MCIPTFVGKKLCSVAAYPLWPGFLGQVGIEAMLSSWTGILTCFLTYASYNMCSASGQSLARHQEATELMIMFIC